MAWMFRPAVAAATLLIAAGGPAAALPITYDVNIKSKVEDPLEAIILDVLLKGEITIDTDDFGRFGPGSEPGLTPVGGFDLDFTYEIDLGDGPEAVTIPINGGTATAVLNNQATRASIDDISILATGLPLGTPLFDITVDKFFDENGLPTEFGFPDGRRLGDDATDVLLLQLFRGSVNLGVAALTDGFAGPPSFVGVGQLSADDGFVLATAAAAAPVPLPAGVLLLGTAVAALSLFARRRSGPVKDHVGAGRGDALASLRRRSSF